MARPRLAWCAIPLTLAATIAAMPMPASAAGEPAGKLPALGVDAGPSGVVVPGSGYRYVALGAGRGTMVAAVERAGGEVIRSRLRGDYSFDAISPNGRWMYLIRYLSRSDFSDYQVRAYDVRARRLDPTPIVDPHAPADQLRGYPITRATSPDSRWAYTLYDGADGMPFIHALDTVRRASSCIDLDGLMGHPNLYGLRLSVADAEGNIRVVDGSGTVALVKKGTWRVSDPEAPRGRDLVRSIQRGRPEQVYAHGHVAQGAPEHCQRLRLAHEARAAAAQNRLVAVLARVRVHEPDGARSAVDRFEHAVDRGGENGAAEGVEDVHHGDVVRDAVAGGVSRHDVGFRTGQVRCRAAEVCTGDVSQLRRDLDSYRPPDGPAGGYE